MFDFAPFFDQNLTPPGTGRPPGTPARTPCVPDTHIPKECCSGGPAQNRVPRAPPMIGMAPLGLFLLLPFSDHFRAPPLGPLFPQKGTPKRSPKGFPGRSEGSPREAQGGPRRLPRDPSDLSCPQEPQNDPKRLCIRIYAYIYAYIHSHSI